jgi:hypothetical protein
MADSPPTAISGIEDPELVRVMLYASGKPIHALLGAFRAATVHGAPTKATPVDTDEFGYRDSAGRGDRNLAFTNHAVTCRSELSAGSPQTTVDDRQSLNDKRAFPI